MHFQLVYVAEAHASDEWPVGGPCAQVQPATTAERAAVAAARLEELGLGALPPALADTAPREAFQELYACWPLRWYFLDGHTLTHIAQPHPGGRYDLNEIVTWLAATRARRLRAEGLLES